MTAVTLQYSMPQCDYTGALSTVNGGSNYSTAVFLPSNDKSHAVHTFWLVVDPMP